MDIFASFVVVGLICMTASLIFDLTKLTPGHITSIFVVIGAILSIFGVYDWLIKSFGYGLSLPITSFGNSLVNGAYKGFQENGFYGLFSGIFQLVSAGISGVIVMSFIMTILCKPKD